MKKPFLLAAIVASGLLLSSTSCKDGGTAGVWGVSGEIPKQVTELKTESDYGRIILSWKIPDDEAFYYAKVKYADPLNGAPVVKDVSIYAADEAGYCEMIVDGLVDTEEQNFSVTSCSNTNFFSICYKK